MLGWLVGALLTLAALPLLYWLIVIGEGSYLGPWAVKLVYRYGASVYDRARHYVTVSDEVHLLGPLRMALAEDAGAAVLDVATGTGRVPLLLAGQPWFNGPIIGIDLSPEMLQVAQQKLVAAGLDGRVSLRCLGAGKLPWPDESFGVVSCLEALEYFPRPRLALREMLRVLRPGGTLIVSAWAPRAARWLPGKALDGQRMAEFLRTHGCEEAQVRLWQPGHYDLVIARKAA